MNKKHEVPFNDVVGHPIDNLPDHVLQTMNDLCSKIMQTALVSEEKQSIHDPNLALGAMQKALALLIATFFPEEMVPKICDRVCDALRSNAVLWSKEDVKK